MRTWYQVLDTSFGGALSFNTLFDYRGNFYNQWGYQSQRCVSSGNCRAVNDPTAPLAASNRLRATRESTRYVRTTIGRRLSSLVSEAEQQIALLGARILKEVKPEADQSEVSAVDGRMYKAQGPKWHKRDRLKDLVPAGLRNVDTESKWSKSGYRGWVQGYRLLLQGLVFPAPVPPIMTAQRVQVSSGAIRGFMG